MEEIRGEERRKYHIFSLVRMVCMTWTCRLPINHPGLYFSSSHPLHLILRSFLQSPLTSSFSPPKLFFSNFPLECSSSPFCCQSLLAHPCSFLLYLFNFLSLLLLLPDSPIQEVYVCAFAAL